MEPFFSFRFFHNEWDKVFRTMPCDFFFFLMLKIWCQIVDKRVAISRATFVYAYKMGKVNLLVTIHLHTRVHTHTHKIYIDVYIRSNKYIDVYICNNKYIDVYIHTNKYIDVYISSNKYICVHTYNYLRYMCIHICK